LMLATASWIILSASGESGPGGHRRLRTPSMVETSGVVDDTSSMRPLGVNGRDLRAFCLDMVDSDGGLVTNYCRAANELNSINLMVLSAQCRFDECDTVH
jgi:hypothetical protein